MKVDTEKETLCMQRMMGQKTEVVMLEGDVIVPDIKPDIISTIHTSGNVCVYKKEVLEGKVRVDGSVEVNLIYLSDTQEGNVRGLTTSVDFTQMLDMNQAKVEMDMDLEVSLKAVECRVLNGRKVSVKASVEFKMKVYSREDVEILKEVKGIQDLQKLDEKLGMNSLVGKGTTKTYAKETIAIDHIDNLAEVLKSNIELTNKDMKVSYNKVLAKADARVSLMYLTEDNRICQVEATIPVMGFIDVPNVTEEHLCDMQYLLKNWMVKPNEIQEHSIYVEAEIELSCRVYETKQVELIQDIYSPECDVCFSQKKVATMVDMQKQKEICAVRESVALQDIAGSKIYNVEVNPSISNMTVLEGRIRYEGEMELKVLYASSQVVGMEEKTTNVSFDFEMMVSGVQNTHTIDTQMEIRSQNFVMMPDGNLEVKVELEFSTMISKNAELNVMDEITVEENRQGGIYSVIIYFVKPGDSLWSIAKKFGSTIEIIAKVNGIEDPNKIYPGRQLFIPRYVPSNREISA